MNGFALRTMSAAAVAAALLWTPVGAQDRLKAMPGFALPYALIPSKDREFPAAPHYSPK